MIAIILKIKAFFFFDKLLIKTFLRLFLYISLGFFEFDEFIYLFCFPTKVFQLKFSSRINLKLFFVDFVNKTGSIIIICVEYIIIFVVGF